MTQGSTSVAPKQKASASGVMLTIIDLVHLAVDVVPVRRPNSSKDAAFKTACPHGLAPVSQKYLCTADPEHGPFTLGDLSKVRQRDDGKVVAATPEEITAAKVGSLEAKELSLHPHPAVEVEAVTRHGESGYRLRPGSKASSKEKELYATLRAVLADRDVAWVGEMRLRDSRKFYRAEVWRDQVVLSELVLPSDLAPSDEITVSANEKLVAMIREIADVEPFDESAYGWDVEASIADLLAAKTGENVTPLSAQTDVDELINLLERSIAAKGAATAA